MKARLVACTVLVLVLSAFAVTPSNASLNGEYPFSFSGAHQYSWGQTLNCGGNFQFWGGNIVRQQTVVGTATFNGAGGVTGTFTEYGQIDQAASDASVSCGNNGNPVFQAGLPGTFTGTYAIQSNGSGAMVLTPTGGGGGGPANFVLQVGGACSSGLENTVYMVMLRADNSVESAGVGRYSGTC